jgi:zinc protease
MTSMLKTEASAPVFDLTQGVERIRLDNELTLLTKEVHGKPIVSSIIWYRVGSRNEELGQTGKSHFLEHMLFKGTDRYAKGEIDLLTLQHGGANNAFTDTDFTAYHFNFAADRWQVALDIEANRMVNNAFVPEEFAAEKEVVEEELRIGLDSPWEALDQAVWAAAYQQHPYHNPVIGWLADLERATREEMEAYYRQWYHPRNATLVIIGDFDTAQTLARARELFGPLPPGPEPKPMLLREQPQRGERRLTVKKTTEVERLQIAFHAPEVAHPDSYPLQVLATILSTGKTSRLYQRLEERDQAVTRFSVDYSDRIDPTLFLLRAEIKPSHATAQVERAILEELDRLQQAPVAAEELQRAKQLITARFALGHEQLAQQAITLGLYETIHCYEHLASFFTRIDEVAADDLQRVAQHYLVADNRTTGYLINDGAKL